MPSLTTFCVAFLGSTLGCLQTIDIFLSFHITTNNHCILLLLLAPFVTRHNHLTPALETARNHASKGRICSIFQQELRRPLGKSSFDVHLLLSLGCYRLQPLVTLARH
jgi:hypothetical protein